jgi:hypothetical protein
MKLNLPILYDRLTGKKRLLSAEPVDSPLDIKGARFLKGGSLDESCLYLAEAADAAVLLKERKGLKLAVTGRIDEKLLSLGQHSAIILPAGTDIFSLEAEILGIFEEHDAWAERLSSALIENRSFQHIFDIGAEMLVNPVALLDSSMALIMKAGRLPQDFSGTIWEVLLENGYVPPDVLPVESRVVIDERILRNEKPFLIQPGKGAHKKNAWLITGLFVGGHLAGRFGSADVNGPFTSGQISLMAHLKRIMELAFSRSEAFSGRTDEFSFFVERLLQGLAIEPNIMAYHLKRHGWKDSDRFCVCCIKSRRTTNAGQNELMGKYIFHLQGILPDSAIVIHEGNIVAIRHSRAGTQPQEEDGEGRRPDTLNGFLRRYNLRAGASMWFSGFQRLRNAYQQSALALELADPGAVSCFSEEYRRRITGLLAGSGKLESLAHPDILRLWQSGRERDRENIRCLHSYLLNGRNLLVTARKLHVHRNTLTYRLEHISAALDEELKSLDDEKLFLLMFSCSLVMFMPGDPIAGE